jgi:anti-sigma-K factor RskA
VSERKSTESEQDNLEQRAQELLQQSAEQLDGYTRSRLTQARHAALDAVKQRQSGVWRWLMPATGATAAAVLAIVIALNPARQPNSQNAVVAQVDEMEIVNAEDGIEFYRDVEFYAWLDSVIDEESAAPAEGEA